MQKADWHEMPAGDQLDSLIAQRLGWRVELRNERNGYMVNEPNWYAIDQFDSARRGGVFIPHVRRDGAEEEAWAGAFYQEDTDSIIPRYSRDANAALTLFGPGGVDGLEYWPEGKPSHWRAFYSPPKAEDRGFEDGDTAPLAICRAWLDWHDNQKPNEKREG